MITTGDSPLLTTTMNDTANIIGVLMMMNTIGLSMIYYEFQRASWHYFKPGWRFHASSDSLAFIQGTGLDMMLQNYGLMYDPDQLRNTFFSMMGDHAKIS